MKKLLLILSLFTFSASQAQPKKWLLSKHASAAASYHYRIITIDHTKVPNTDQTDFPVLISGTYTYLKTIANGGEVTNANGYDIGFYTDATFTTKLKWETEKYVASTGEVAYWVKVPTLSHTTDPVIYEKYADATVTTDQSDPTNVWDANYKGVYHLKDGSTLSGADATSGVANGTITSTTATTGQIDGGASFDGSTSHILTSGITGDYSSAGLTYSVWIKPNFASTSNTRQGIIDWTSGTLNSGTDDPRLRLIWLDNTNGFYFDQKNNFAYTYHPTFTSNTWHHLVFTITPSANTGQYYWDGVPVTTVNLVDNSVRNSTSTFPLFLGVDHQVSTLVYDGVEDEFRLSIIVRSADWIATEYNNQSSPSTFYTIGSEL